jgi:predicted DsbA family dithiol-disulfide isomerase
MKVEIWSDVVCPFCYIGKRKFENALKNFSNKEDVEVVWKSFQLDPTTQSDPNKSVAQSLAEKKGWTLEQVKQVNAQVSQSAKEVGLEYHLDKAIVANTLDAHRLIHLAAQHQLQDEAEERLFKAYFTEGKDIGKKDTLVTLGVEIGLIAEEVQKVLENNQYALEVQQDQYEAQQVGVRGVPFFVFNNKYAVSGAQPSEVFSEVLSKVWEEEHPVAKAEDNATFCSIDGTCS